MGSGEQLIGAVPFGGRGFLYGGNLIRGGGGGTHRDRQLGPMLDALVEGYSLRGLNGIDLIEDGSGTLWFLEINPRFTAAMELYAKNGRPGLFREHVRACQGVLAGAGGQPEPEGPFHGKAIVYAREEITVPPTDTWFGHGIRDIPHEGTRIGPGHPVCTVFAGGTDRTGCLDALVAVGDRVTAWCSGRGVRPGLGTGGRGG